MSMSHRGVLLALLLVAPALAMSPVASAACATGTLAASAVPCGRIYPIITLTTEGGAYANLTQGQQVDIQGKVDFQFRALGDGYSPVPPTDPIVITFEFPRKPAWVDMSVAPDTIVVDVNNPTYFTPDPTNAQGPEMFYDYTASFTLHVTLTGQAVLRDGLDYAKLLLFAKSSENGLYQSGYGIKEIRVIPAGAVHESDVAGLQDHFAATPLSNFTLAPATAKVAGTTVTLTPPSSGAFWAPAKFSAKLDPAPTGKVLVALHDEAGDLVFASQPLDASSGTVAFTATLAKPGLHTATFTLLPDVDSPTPPVTIPVDLPVGDVSVEGYAFPKDYVVTDDGITPTPNGNTADALAQFERDVPVYAFDSAQSVTATLSLTTPGQDLGKGAASLQMLLLDPEGKPLQTASADPITYPQRSLRIGSVPVEGWYTVRVKGVGLPTASSWNVKAEVAYATPPTVRNHADDIADVTPATTSRGGQNITLPVGGLQLWTPSDITPRMDKMDGARYGISVYGPDGALAYASGLRSGKASFSAPIPGQYRAFVYAQPTMPGTPFAPTVRAFAFGVGATNTTVAQKFAIADTPEVPQSPTGSIVALYAVPGGADAKVELTSDQAAVGLTEAPAKDALGNATKLIVVSATNPGPATSASVKATVDFATPQTLVGPLAKTDGGAPKGIPGFGLATVAVALCGAVWVVARRRR